ncbi:hypothetical protein NADFUDRAFT_83821 [Nadsonia fulvescens var. elongata DSM 6958]|uniref:DUF1237-domain-containing protein n=1 Tax=Nadsonia fulvescens var. elongata DSM 6958 TaxID=857566 RepID=A0A1E3PFU0_9ASCO|nr:hypothetical protein NADFUDRAFT_83821 [Nadsonia fulvescens var. elongata DSM 6958]
MTTYSRDGEVSKNWYTFKRWTDIGTETLPLDGAGNPTGRNTQLIRSSFRPSDDSTIFQFHIPSNAQIVVQFERTAKLLQSAYPNIAQDLESRALLIREGIMQHGIVDHKVFGRVFAYEVDGYGSINIMDDANIPSLLSLPLLGFIKSDNPIYLNTRKMILCKEGNPYYITGVHFHGIGGPHIGTRMAWPMSHIVEGRTLVHQNRESASTRVKELMTILKESTSGLGLMHESVGVDRLGSWTRPWFAWCNAEMGAFILEALELGYLDTVY